MGLKSRSYGPDDERKLIVSRKINIRSLVKELKTVGGVTEKYELVKPNKIDETTEKFDCRTDSTNWMEIEQNIPTYE